MTTKTIIPLDLGQEKRVVHEQRMCLASSSVLSPSFPPFPLLFLSPPSLLPPFSFPPFSYLRSTGHYLCDEYPQACTHMEGSKEECHCADTSCEGGERKRGIDILKVPLSGLVPV